MPYPSPYFPSPIVTYHTVALKAVGRVPRAALACESPARSLTCETWRHESHLVTPCGRPYWYGTYVYITYIYARRNHLVVAASAEYAFLPYLPPCAGRCEPNNRMWATALAEPEQLPPPPIRPDTPPNSVCYSVGDWIDEPPSEPTWHLRSPTSLGMPIHIYPCPCYCIPFQLRCAQGDTHPPNGDSRYYPHGPHRQSWPMDIPCAT